jgi:putative ABC transport system ATP-binding protein
MPPSASSDAPGLLVEDLTLSYPTGDALQTVLAIDRFAVEPGSRVGLSGGSGAGKTSLLHVITGIARADRGRVQWGGVALSALPEAARDAWRRSHVGLVFQDVHLVGELTALENVLLPWRFDHWRLPVSARRDALALLDRMGVSTPDRRAGLLSRGEQQRVGLARALVRAPSILVADEPTASLDADAARIVADLLIAAAESSGTTLIVISHDEALLARLPRRMRLAAGKLREEQGS